MLLLYTEPVLPLCMVAIEVNLPVDMWHVSQSVWRNLIFLIIQIKYRGVFFLESLMLLIVLPALALCKPRLQTGGAYASDCVLSPCGLCVGIRHMEVTSFIRAYVH